MEKCKISYFSNLAFDLTGNHPKNFGGSRLLGSGCGQVAKRVGKSRVGNGDLLS